MKWSLEKKTTIQLQIPLSCPQQILGFCEDGIGNTETLMTLFGVTTLVLFHGPYGMFFQTLSTWFWIQC